MKLDELKDRGIKVACWYQAAQIAVGRNDQLGSVKLRMGLSDVIAFAAFIAEGNFHVSQAAILSARRFYRHYHAYHKFDTKQGREFIRLMFGSNIGLLIEVSV